MKVNPKDKALKSICKKLDEKEAIYDEEAVSRVVDNLYDAYEADGTIPTREAFAEACQDETVADAVKAMERDPFEKRSLGKGGIVAICIACAVIIALIVGTAVIVPTWAGSEIENAETTAENAKTNENDDEEEAEDTADEASEEASGSSSPDTSSTSSGSSSSGSSSSSTSSGSSTSGGSSSSSSNSNKSSSSSSSSKNSSSSTTTSGGSSGGSTSSGSSNSGSTSSSSISGSTSSGSSSSAHTHSWTYHEAVTTSYYQCNGCGEKFSDLSSLNAHTKAAALSGNSACRSYTTVQETTQNAYYSCSCGATK